MENASTGKNIPPHIYGKLDIVAEDLKHVLQLFC